MNSEFSSLSKVDNIKTFKDTSNNLYISYTGKFNGLEGQTISDYYLKIDTGGNEEKLNYKMNIVELRELFKTLKQVKL